MKPKKLKSKICTEAHTVKFWFKKTDGFWEQREETFKHIRGKNSYEYVSKLFLKKYKNNQVNIISISYQ